MKQTLSWLSLGLLSLLLTACLNAGSSSPPAPSGTSDQLHSGETSSPHSSDSEPSPHATETSSHSAPVPSEPEISEATLLAVGDILIHMPLLPAYYDKATDSYDFNPWFAEVKPILEQGDWVIGNLESPIAGKELKYSGYPRFNAPTELADALAATGFHLVSTANNHSMDRGFPGVQRTLENVRKAGLVPVGTAANEAASHLPVIIEKNGIHMGFLAYTYGTNGIPIPPESSFAVNLIELERIKGEIAALRTEGADLVTVSLHFGLEYQRMPNEDQTRTVRELVDAGADIILGSHPHVVQPYEEIDITAEESSDGTARRGIVIYSLGNFISNQTNDWKDVGLIFGVQVTKVRQPDGSSVTTWDTVTTYPTWVHIRRKDGNRYYTIIPMEQALKDKNNPDLTDNDYSRIELLLSGINKHLLQLAS